MSGSNIITGTLDLLVLRILAGGPLHGYGVGRALRTGSAGVLEVEEGVLYPALHRLEERGLIEGRWRRTEANRRAKVYELTPVGREALAESTREWEAMSGAVTDILTGSADT